MWFRSKAKTIPFSFLCENWEFFVAASECSLQAHMCSIIGAILCTAWQEWRLLHFVKELYRDVLQGGTRMFVVGLCASKHDCKLCAHFLKYFIRDGDLRFRFTYASGSACPLFSLVPQSLESIKKAVLEGDWEALYIFFCTNFWCLIACV